MKTTRKRREGYREQAQTQLSLQTKARTSVSIQLLYNLKASHILMVCSPAIPIDANQERSIYMHPIISRHVRNREERTVFALLQACSV